jgi:hypothetical protein
MFAMSQSTATSALIDFITRAGLAECPAEAIEKFGECASIVLSPEDTRAVFEAAESIEEMKDVGELVRLLTRTPVASR